jgi:thymidylate synthase
MKQFHDNLQFILDNGSWKTNRTQYASLMVPGLTMRFDLRQGFPAVTTKKLAFKSAIGELVGFLRSTRNAADFRKLGCKVWDQNANENTQWLANPFRKGEDDLGDVYGAMWREWPAFKQGWFSEQQMAHLKASGWTESSAIGNEGWIFTKQIDMLGDCVRKIILEPDDRRILFHAWNPAKLDEMALPPCHLLYHFLPNKDTKELALCMTQRSADYFLGIPFNIASAALLLHIVARLTGYTPTWLTITTNDSHIYENAIDATKELLTREPYPLPRLDIHPGMASFDQIEAAGKSLAQAGGYEHTLTQDADAAVRWLTHIDPAWFTLSNYQYHESIKVDMAV